MKIPYTQKQIDAWYSHKSSSEIEEEKQERQEQDNEPWGINVAHELAGGLTEPSY